MAREAFIVVDFGSSAVKVEAVSLEGELVAGERWRPRLLFDEVLPFIVEHDPREIEERLLSSIRAVAGEAGSRGYRIAGLGCTSQRYNMVLLDREHRAVKVSPNVDSRGFVVSKTLDEAEAQELYRATGLYPPQLFTPMRLEWFRENDPDLLSRISKVLAIHDWLVYLLSGELATDPTMAASTMLFDLDRGAWSHRALEIFELDPEALPDVVPAGSVIGSVSRDIARALGLPEGLPVIACGGDSQASLVATGRFEPGDTGVVAGYTVPIFMGVERGAADESRRVWFTLHAEPGIKLLECNAGPLGKLFEWFIKAFRVSGYEELERLASLSSIGSRGVRMRLYPSVMDASRLGERDVRGFVELPPLVLPGAEGVELSDLTRGLFEFVAMSIRANVEVAAQVCGRRPGVVRLVGGLTRLKLLKEMLPHVLRSPLAVATRYYSGSLGCAVMAAASLGYYRDWWEAAAAMSPLERLSPDDALASDYQAVYTSWEGFYMRLEGI
uniref:Carbohydrate kinase n=1 Tax=Thermofilum pendens TaxID=2269 RepID=A0A7C4FEY8_THEPE